MFPKCWHWDVDVLLLGLMPQACSNWGADVFRGEGLLLQLYLGVLQRVWGGTCVFKCSGGQRRGVSVCSAVWGGWFQALMLTQKLLLHLVPMRFGNLIQAFPLFKPSVVRRTGCGFSSTPSFDVFCLKNLILVRWRKQIPACGHWN